MAENILESMIELKEQINEVNGYLYLNNNLPNWIKDAAYNGIKNLKIRIKVLETFEKK